MPGFSPRAFDPPTIDDRRLWDNWLSAHRFPALTAADACGLLARLCSGASTTSDLARELGLAPRPLDVLLGYLAAQGFAARDPARAWHATELTRAWLDPSQGAYWGPLLEVFSARNALHDQVLETLRRDEVAVPGQTAVEEWERGELPSERAQVIAAFMNAHSISAAAAMARQPPIRGCRALLDVGGGSGVFSIAAAQANESLRATVLDIDTMCEVAAAYIEASGQSERVGTTAVNMFTEPLPSGHDLHFYSNVFHDWSERTNALLAEKSFDALPPGGRIVLHEMLVDEDGCGPETTLSFSLLMLLGTRGRQYRLSELRAILEEAGFVDVQAAPTGSAYYSLVEARKP